MPKASKDRLELTLNLREAYEAAKLRRAKRAINMIKEKVRRITGAEVVKLSNELNEFVWSRGAERPPRKLSILIEEVEEGEVLVRLKGEREGSE